MATGINDILLWIESPIQFEKGIGKLCSNDEVRRKKMLLKEILEDSIEAWMKMSSSQLEQTLSSLAGIVDRCKKLTDKFLSDIDFYENGLYEVILPHEWEGMPPTEGNPEVIEAAIKVYYVQQQESIEQTKSKINEVLFNVHGYHSIADNWHDESIRCIAIIKRKIDEKNLVGSKLKVAKAAELGNVPIPSLKPKEGLDYYSGLPKLRAGLIEIELISPEVELPEIRALFGFNEMTTRFPWKGPRVAIRQFILDLLEFKKIEEFPSRKKWETVAKIFIIEDEPNKDIGSLKGDNDLYKFQKELQSLVQNL